MHAMRCMQTGCEYELRRLPSLPAGHVISRRHPEKVKKSCGDLDHSPDT